MTSDQGLAQLKLRLKFLFLFAVKPFVNFGLLVV
jgi:hypothetical protein